MYSVQIDDDQINPLVVAVLREWFPDAPNMRTAESILGVLEYASVLEEHREWLQSIGYLE